MPVYAVGMINIHDRERYGRYRETFMPILTRFGGRMLAADEQPSVQEGRWPYEKLIIIEFDDEEHFRRWSESEDYQAIAKDRRAASVGVTLLARGLPGASPLAGSKNA